MANTIITAQKIVNEGLRIIHNESAMLKRVGREYDSEFGRRGGKPGDTVYVRRPPQFTIRDGPVANIQDVNQSKIPVTIQPEFGVDMAISDFDLTLSFDRFTEDIIQPAAARIAAELDSRIVTMATNATYNSVGDPTSLPSSQVTAQKLALDAGVMLTLNGAQKAGRSMVINPVAEANLVQYLNLGFNNQSTIGKQYTEGGMDSVGRALGFDWYSSPNMISHTNGVRGGTPLVNGASQGTINSGATDNPRADTTSLVTDGWTAAVATRVKKGDTFTLGSGATGVYAVNPENKQVSSSLQQFTATADAASDGSGNMTIVVSPAIIAGGAFQNVSQRPPDNAVLTFVGATSGVYPVSLAFADKAFTLATVDMDVPNGVDMAAQKTFDGVSMRFVRWWDGTNNRRVSRFDILAGYAAVRPEWSTRVYAG